MSNQKDRDILTKDQDSVTKDPKALTTTAILRGSVKKQGKNEASNHTTSHCINEIMTKKRCCSTKPSSTRSTHVTNNCSSVLDVTENTSCN